MYISKIQLENIRGFRSGELRVDLDLRRPDGRYAGWTVLAGRNGSGKSTLLKAVALALAGPFVARVLQQSFVGWIREGQETSSVSTELVLGGEDCFSEQVDLPSRDLWTELIWIHLQSGAEPALLEWSTFRGEDPTDESMQERVSQGRRHGPWAINPMGWFMAGYGPYRRLSGHAPDTQRLMGGPLPLSRLVSLFREDASLIESVQWLKELHLRRLEKREGAEELLQGVLQLLNDGLLPDSTKVDKVDSEGLWVTQRGVALPLRDMSDGYRTVVALVMDLVRQLHATYGELKLAQQDGRLCVLQPGVVLIDEIELHLHLSWQRRIGFWFKEHFPNIQFIVTTHSPFVCQAADPKGLIRLAAPGENRTAEHVSDELYKTVVNGTVDEAALTELFGLEHVHSDESERLRERVAQLEARVLRGEATPEEREQLEQLSAQLPDTGSELVERAVRKLGLDK
ncbi:AAA family ATPase [Archangium sp.]|uniref:AAA family ATPase n=1 Tax=Archangium sp. TaxID=1872627 RepID=UPI00286BA51D|nr:AAA family ATPase [Archangium sp.]